MLTFSECVIRWIPEQFQVIFVLFIPRSHAGPLVWVAQRASCPHAVYLLAESHKNGVAEPDELGAAQVIKKRNASVEHSSYSGALVPVVVAHELHVALHYVQQKHVNLSNCPLGEVRQKLVEFKL